MSSTSLSEQAHRATPAVPQREPGVFWGRRRTFCQHYGVENTTAYSWLAAGRVRSRKIGGVRVWEIGTVRGIDNDAEPEPSWAIPAAARPENQGRYYGHRRKVAAPVALAVHRAVPTAGTAHELLERSHAPPLEVEPNAGGAV